jgi:hypothetical protein
VAKHLEIESNSAPVFAGFTGRFQWRVLKLGVEKATGYNDISAVTGNIEGGTMVSISQCTSILTEDAIITYIFYDAGHGEADLPSRDQCAISVTPTSNKTWMQSLTPPGSLDAQKPFSRFVLPTPHDPGMNSMEGCDACFHTAQTEHISEWVEQLPNLTPFKNFSPSSLLNFLPNILYALAITQTSSIGIMLTMGARYFEFRPAKLYPLFGRTSGLRDTHYFTHAFLPGLAFDTFLSEVARFLEENQNKIVVTHLRRDGVVKDCTSPTVVKTEAYLDAACSSASNTLGWTNRSGLYKSIDTLRQSNSRIVLLNNDSQYSSYNDAANATVVPDPIIRASNGMSTKQQATADVTILQCQATATNIKEVVAYSVLSSNASNSPLVATKAICDQQTLPWCWKNVIKKLGVVKTVVIMNDFFDGGTADTAIRLSAERLAMC